MSTAHTHQRSRPPGALAAKIMFAALLVITTFGIGATAQASASKCMNTWGSLPEVSDRLGVAHMTGLRTGRHTCFDRLVIDLAGNRPGYDVEYVDAVFAEGSGDPVPVEGGAILNIVVLAPAHDLNGVATVDPAEINATNVAGYSTFRDVEWAGSFEGHTTIGLGVRARLPFRTFVLSGPGDGTRLVIDVAHRWTSSGATPSSDLPGKPFEGFARAGDELAVMGVAHDDVLNIRKAPGTDQRIVATASPTADDLVATGRARMLSRSIWYEVTVNGTTGWAGSRFLGFVGDTDDVTASYLNGGPAPASSTMGELGRVVAYGFASDDPPSRIVQSVAPSVGDLGEVTYDVIGLGDDSVAGVRLHIFAVPHDSGDGFVLTSIEATNFCIRAGDELGCA